MQDYLTLDNHLYSIYFLCINNNTWESLTPEQQEILTVAAQRYSVVQRGLEQRQNYEALTILEEKGNGDILSHPRGYCHLP